MPLPASAPQIKQVLPGLFRPYPVLGLTEGDLGAYRHLRNVEPSLVSMVDGKELPPDAALGVVTLSHRGHPIAVVSYGVQSNQMKPGPANRFARIDLVIVEPSQRGVGAGKLVVLCALAHLLEKFGSALYSISSLAAHGAIQKVLEEVSFSARGAPERGYVHEELRLEEGAVPALAGDLRLRAEKTLQAVAYALRQREGSP